MEFNTTVKELNVIKPAQITGSINPPAAKGIIMEL